MALNAAKAPKTMATMPITIKTIVIALIAVRQFGRFAAKIEHFP
jgi:hypothetical protein